MQNATKVWIMNFQYDSIKMEEAERRMQVSIHALFSWYDPDAEAKVQAQGDWEHIWHPEMSAWAQYEQPKDIVWDLRLTMNETMRPPGSTDGYTVNMQQVTTRVFFLTADCEPTAFICVVS